MPEIKEIIARKNDVSSIMQGPTTKAAETLLNNLSGDNIRALAELSKKPRINQKLSSNLPMLKSFL